MKMVLVLAGFALGPLLLAEERDAPLGRYQIIGTHNSYHLAPQETEREFIRLRGQGELDGLEYSHLPLSEQFASGIRQIELDCFADSEGGAFAKPAALQLARLAGKDVTPQPDPEGLLEKPGTKILHFPDFDFRTNVLTLTSALAQVRDWSQANPTHFPIFVLLELKGPSAHWKMENLLALEEEILSVLSREHILTPDDVRGTHPDLRTAILNQGWPSLEKAAGKIILALDNTNEAREAYLAPDPLLKGRLLFPSGPSESHPASAWFKLNDAIGDFETIQKLSAQGFLVRTRADVGTVEARQNDLTRREKAFASGAQIISTDFPTANPEFSDYAVGLPQGAKEYYRYRQD